MPNDVSKPWVDSHFHVFEAGVGVAGARYLPPYAAPLDAWRQAARAQGVTRGLLVQPSFLGTDNRLLLHTLRQHPAALRGVAVVAPDVAPAELAELHTAGVRGIRLNLVGTDHDVSPWQRADALWQALHQRGWHLELHTDAGELPPVVAHLLPHVPDGVPLVVDHMGKPASAHAQDATVQALTAVANRRSVHVKLSGAYRMGGLDPAVLARLWLRALGPERLLWGSDWPCTNHEVHADYGRLLSALTEWVGPDAAQCALTDNPTLLCWS